MEENPKKRSRAAIVTLVTLLVAYPLSSGPALTLVGATSGVTGPNPAALFAFKAIYAPLALVFAALPNSCEDAAMRWLMLWDVYGVF